MLGILSVQVCRFPLLFLLQLSLASLLFIVFSNFILLFQLQNSAAYSIEIYPRFPSTKVYSMKLLHLPLTVSFESTVVTYPHHWVYPL